MFASLTRGKMMPSGAARTSAQLLASFRAPSLSRSFFGSQTGGEKLFDKILIANRGEIALRIMRTCKKLGIKTVAVYSDADLNALHVRHADEAVNIGPAPSSQSYLDGDAILRACKLTGAQAVHPGYGFLSEKSYFADLLEQNGVVFIGPKAKAMQAMGDKIESKKLANSAKVNTIPGFAGVVQGDEQVLKIAREIGYPVMIKASAGGGGKGMRVAFNDKEALSGFALSTQEARSSFADDRVFIEKYIEEPRHIEIQLIADSHGNCVYLNERECSIQRRNQKVIEEAPSTFLTPEVRKAMGEQAVSLAKAVGYESAGTVEFLVDKHRKFYFLEMNTRLQVEHPVSELITGVDLVHQMIRVAAGHKLNFAQKDIGIKGWALESRVYAEDPLRNFLPSIGRLRKYQEPRTDPADPTGIRCDAGVAEGSDISIHYDPMICKLITYGEDRKSAVEKMKTALDSYVIRGVTHNVNFLRSLLEHERFLKGELSTAFIPQEYPDGYKGHVLNTQQARALVGTSAVLHLASILSKSALTGQLQSYKPQTPEALHVTIGAAGVTGVSAEHKVLVESLELDGDHYHAKLLLSQQDGKTEKSAQSEISLNWTKGSLLIDASVDGQNYVLQLVATKGSSSYTVQHIGTKFDVRVLTNKEFELNQLMPVKAKADQTKVLMSPMPGCVFDVKVNVGDNVVEGQEVCVVEAMKMQNALMAPRTGKVKKVNVKKGSTVQADDVLIEFE